MKISCQSCEAKYTIADEKVRGKVVKIRCKKCSATIIVKGTELPPPDYDDAPTRVLDRDELAFGDGRPSDEWTLSVTDDDQRTVTSEEIAALYRSGTVDDDTFAWRDGMDDWLPLGQIEELRAALGPARASLVSAPSAVAPKAPAPSPSAAERAAVRRPESGRGSTDLFGAAALAGSDSDAGVSSSARAADPSLTGARNESSVLFSLSALTGSAPAPQRAADTESSSVIDLQHLMAPSPAARPASSGTSKVDDIMNLGGTGIFAASFATPAVESIPPTPTGASGSSAPSEKSNKGLLIGVLALAGVVVLGVGGFFAFGRGGGESPAPTADATSQTAPVSAPAPEPEAPAAAPAAAAATALAKAEPPEDPQAGGEAPPAPAPKERETALASATPAPAAVQPAVAREKEKPAPAPAKTAEKTAAKPAPAPAPPPKPAAPVPSEAPPFDRAAALSSLNSASDAAAAACKKPGGPTGSGRIAVTFAPNGVVTTANVEGPPFAGTAVGSCVAAKFRSARVPAFSGGIVTVRKSFTIN